MKKLVILAILFGSSLQAANFKVTWRAQGGNNNKLVTITALQDGIILNDAKVNRGNCKSTFGLQKAMVLEMTKTPSPKPTKISLRYPKNSYPKTTQEFADYLPKMFSQEKKMCYGTERILEDVDRDISRLEQSNDEEDKGRLTQLKQDREKLFAAYEDFFCPTEKKIAEMMEQTIRNSKAEKFGDAVEESYISSWDEYFTSHPEQKADLKILSYNWDDYVFYLKVKLCESDEDCKGKIDDSDVERVNAMDDNQLIGMDNILNELAPKVTLKQPENEWKNKSVIAYNISRWQDDMRGGRYYGVNRSNIKDVAQELDDNLKNWMESEKKFKEHTQKGVKFQEKPTVAYGRGDSHKYLYPLIALTDAYAEIAPKIDPKTTQAKQPTGIKFKYGESFEFGVDVRCQILDVQLTSNRGVETFKF